ncbi:MAG: hypothetical protein GY749_47545 [Desulfobacteraceae bacterium]|nr:hypothetical protein [Desulfobacteraceae bacterium]
MINTELNLRSETDNILSRLLRIAEKLEISDLAENHDEYLYGKQMRNFCESLT